MDITISQGMKRFEFLDLVDLEPDIGVGINRRPSGSSQVDHLTVILLDPIKLNPGDMMFHGIGMGHLMSHHDADDIPAFLVSFIDGDSRHMFFLAFILIRFDDLGKIHFIPPFLWFYEPEASG
jgi:hypothetical protein